MLFRALLLSVTTLKGCVAFATEFYFSTEAEEVCWAYEVSTCMACLRIRVCDDALLSVQVCTNTFYVCYARAFAHSLTLTLTVYKSGMSAFEPPRVCMVLQKFKFFGSSDCHTFGEPT